MPSALRHVAACSLRRRIRMSGDGRMLPAVTNPERRRDWMGASKRCPGRAVGQGRQCEASFGLSGRPDPPGGPRAEIMARDEDAPCESRRNPTQTQQRKPAHGGAGRPCVRCAARLWSPMATCGDTECWPTVARKCAQLVRGLSKASERGCVMLALSNEHVCAWNDLRSRLADEDGRGKEGAQGVGGWDGGRPDRHLDRNSLS
jgi:hypothetical protein